VPRSHFHLEVLFCRWTGGDTSDLGIVNSLRTVSFISSRFYMADVLGISILYYIDTIIVQPVTLYSICSIN
jgi:hypothetical protein